MPVMELFLTSRNCKETSDHAGNVPVSLLMCKPFVTPVQVKCYLPRLIEDMHVVKDMHRHWMSNKTDRDVKNGQLAHRLLWKSAFCLTPHTYYFLLDSDMIVADICKHH